MGSNMPASRRLPLLISDPPVNRERGMERPVAVKQAGWSFRRGAARGRGDQRRLRREILIDNADEYSLRKFVGLNERTWLESEADREEGPAASRRTRSSRTGAATLQGEPGSGAQCARSRS